MISIVSTLGAGSGIDTKALIDELVAAEKSARTAPLTARATTLDARISALAQVRSAIQGIGTSLDTRVRSGALGLVPQSSNPAALAIERLGTGPASAFVSDITINRLATAQQLTAPPLGVSDAPVGGTAADAPVGRGILTVQFGTRTDLGDGNFSFAGGGADALDIVIDASNNSLTGLRDAINRAGAGVTASIVANSGSATLSLRGSDGGASAFIISAAPAADDPGPSNAGLARFAYTPGNRAMVLATSAADAELSIDGIAVTRPRNIIDDLVTGTRITLKKADPQASTTIAAARDPGVLSSTVSDLAETLNAMRGLIADFRKPASGSDAAAALGNDATARAIDQRLAGLAATPFAEANGLRLRDLGVDINRDGSITFDAARFARLPPIRLADVEALLKALAAPALSTRPNRLQSIAALATPAATGLTRRRAAVTTELAKVDTRLATYRTTLTRQYAAMDRLVSASKAVQAQLDQQIAAWNKRDST